jgi:hypothetical protein
MHYPQSIAKGALELAQETDQLDMERNGMTYYHMHCLGIW